MALWDLFRKEPRSQPESRTLVEVLDDPSLELVDTQPTHITMAAKESVQTTVGVREIGSASPSPFTSWTRQEYNSKLMGLTGLRTYDKMRRGDATVRSSLRMMRTPVLAADWYIEPASQSARDKNVADFIWQNLTEWMSLPFDQFLYETTLMLEFGYYAFEKVFTQNDPRAPGKTIWAKLAPRHPMDVKQWFFDSNGGPQSVEMWPPEMVLYEDITIPIEKLLVFTFDKEAGNIEGFSILRSAYKHWYYKDQLYKIDAIQKERHGIGIPVVKLPPNFNDQDRRLADQIGRNLRTNERAHIVLPPNWEIEFADLRGNPVDALKSAEHHDGMIKLNVLAAFMAGIQGGGSGGAAITTLEQVFLKSAQQVAVRHTAAGRLQLCQHQEVPEASCPFDC
jgi:hypothetical protein